MPETSVALRWPDGVLTRHYSPSLVVHEHLVAGSAYPLAEVVERSRTALTIASERVRELYGFPCTRAAASLQQVEATAASYAEGLVEVL